ncbi:MAG: metalloregulator ArsR/SmtB family transcription factor [Actinomycetota bacterium]|nr:metalloregulator ArsR/SmtB family transcription factor [Actinomycetota bacterium]
MRTEAQINVAVAARPLDEPGARQFAQLLAALADPTRLRILTALETVCVPVGGIVAATGLPQPTVSYHLRILRDRGLVVADRRGQQVFYCLADDGLVEAFCTLRGFVPGGAR